MTDSDNDTSEARLFFNTYDRNNSGYIGYTEFVGLARSINSHITEEQIKQGFRHIDRDKDGRIGFEEFLVWWEDR